MSLLRSGPTRIYYGDNRSSASFDLLVVATAVAVGMLGLAWIIVWPTAKRARNTIIMHAAHAFAIYVFLVPILGLVCKSWQSGTIRTSAPYSAYSASEVNGTVGLYVGLGSFNVTLVGEPEFQNTSATSPNEQINYNEIVDFGVRQARVGFGEYGNAVNREYRRLQNRGLPYPLAWVMELFTNDGDGLRWGRNYRQAGYFAQVLLWTSVAMWAITLMTLAAGVWGISASVNEERDGKAAHAAHAPGIEGGTLQRSFLLRSQLRPASILCACTGLLQTAAPCIYVAILRASPGSPVSIAFSTGTLELTFGWCFWLMLCTGIVVLALGLAGLAWSTYGYSASIRDLEFVWADVPADGHRHGERSASHRRARSMSTEVGSTYAPRPHGHRSNGSGAGSSLSDSVVKSPESAVLTGVQVTSPLVLEPTTDQTPQPKTHSQQQQQQQQPQPSSNIELMPSTFPSSVVPSAVPSALPSSSTPTSAVRASLAAAAHARGGLEAIPDASEEAELDSATTPMAQSAPRATGLEVASGSPAAAPARTPQTESQRVNPAPAPPAIVASTPSALPLYSGPSTGLLDTSRADETMAAGPQHFVYGADAAETKSQQ